MIWPMDKRYPLSKRPTTPRFKGFDYTFLETLGFKFAVEYKMLTDDEIQAVQDAQAMINGSRLLNINAKLTFPTGTYADLYKDRRYDVLGDQLLGQIPNPRKP